MEYQWDDDLEWQIISREMKEEWWQFWHKCNKLYPLLLQFVDLSEVTNRPGPDFLAYPCHVVGCGNPTKYLFRNAMLCTECYEQAKEMQKDNSFQTPERKAQGEIVVYEPPEDNRV